MSVHRYKEVKRAIEDNVVETMGVELSIRDLEATLERLDWDIEDTQHESERCEQDFCELEDAKRSLESELEDLEMELVELGRSEEFTMDSEDENQVGLW